jgi:hypothetical protein
MAFCTSCGKSIAEAVKFCPECGAAQQPAAEGAVVAARDNLTVAVESLANMGWITQRHTEDAATLISSQSGKRVTLTLQRDGSIRQGGDILLDLSRVVPGLSSRPPGRSWRPHPPTPEVVVHWGGTLMPTRGQPIFSPAFRGLHNVFTIRLKNGREAQVVKKRTTIDSHHTVIEIAQASGDPAPF